MACLEAFDSIVRTIRYDPGTTATLNFAGGIRIDSYGFQQTVLCVGYQIQFFPQAAGSTLAGGEWWNAVLAINTQANDAAGATANSLNFPMQNTIGFSNAFYYNTGNTDARRFAVPSTAVFFPKDQGKKINEGETVGVYICTEESDNATAFYVVWSLYWVPWATDL